MTAPHHKNRQYMLTEYKPDYCKYTFNKLKKVVYIVSEDHLKYVHIDNGQAYISGLTELPLRLNGFDIKFTEEESLDERYLFTKTVTLSMHSYVNNNIFEGKFYIILEDYEGTYWMVNVDFPSRVTYTFNLSNQTYQTDFTLTSYSNFPTLKLNADFVATEPPCLGLNVFGVKALKLIDFPQATINTRTKKIEIFGDYEFVDVEYLGNSCSLTETYDGFNCTDSISFQIPFDAYKSSWHYNIGEFMSNKYSAIVTPKSSNNEFYVGFNLGLNPIYRIETGDRENSDIITVTLTETSVHGLTSAVDWTQEQRTETKWVWAMDVDGLPCWECVARGKAKYLLKKEVLDNGVGTGDYMCLDGYEDYFSGTGINLVDTFSGETLFDNSACEGEPCQIWTNLSSNHVFTSVTCTTNVIYSDCDWSIVNKTVDWLTITPMSGSAGDQTSVTICNTKTPTGYERGYFDIVAGGNMQHMTVTLDDQEHFINPTSVNVNCLSQDVYFTFDPTCPITVWNSDARTTWSRTNGNLIIRIPRNYELSGTSYEYTIKNCDNKTNVITINQDQTYEQWLATTGYLCESGNSYTREARYTGTTSGTCNVMTGEYRKGTLIASGDTRCAEYVYTRWVTSSEYLCLDGNKWSQEEQQTSTDNIHWTSTGIVRPKEMIESGSTDCEQTITYSWVLTEQWQCDEHREVSGIPYCSGTTKVVDWKEQVSYDGVTWEDTGESGITVVEYDSPDCYVPPTPTGYSGQYLTIESTKDDNRIVLYTTMEEFTVSASTDNGQTWSAVTAYNGNNTTIATLNTGDKVLLKGLNDRYHSTLNSTHSWFITTKQYNIYGNIMSLVYGDNFTGQTTVFDNAFYQIFYTSLVVDASNLILPATTLGKSCYREMFKGCGKLLAAPELPAMTMEEACYKDMFYNCSGLTTAPELPATTLAQSCYQYMFYGCKNITSVQQILPATSIPANAYAYMFDGCRNITTAPELPATTLGDSCYSFMFMGCSGLTTAPVLSATTLASNCYQYMFYNCTSLNYIKCLATDISASNCTKDWVSGVASSGTFVKNSSMTGWSRNTSGIPSNWTVQDAS